MSRLHFKGGAWTNAEDEVMKAALAQYGLRDWERVASMLTKKTAMQCRERWENYLDPRLNIHEAWSLEEEEKLVELQALFPHKWRLISEQLTRRTPNHYIRPAWLCEQRYLELKDEQEYYLKQQQHQLKDAPGGAAGEKQSLESFMAERRRRRIARKTHEERASRADTVSGERSEREMIDMATSRLANQDQKKGLRKERQQQLAEAAFLAKLESNREGIESGTLSLRQTRKMEKALEEDRQKPNLVDEIEEAGEEDDTGSEGRDSGENDEQFEAIDMYEDQKQAGLVKKQRILMKDLTEQQRLIQQRQINSAADADGDEEASVSPSGGSRARTALTGVNQDLLKQLTSAPTSASPSLLECNALGTRAITAAGKPVTGANSIAAAAAAEAKEELKSTLDSLFATLPSASRAAPAPTLTSPSAELQSPSPLPPLKRPRQASRPASVAEGEDGSASHSREVAQVQVPEVPSRSSGRDSIETKRTDNNIPEDLFGILDIPAPRKIAKTEATATAATDSSNGASRSGEPRAPIHANADSSDPGASRTSASNAQYGISFTESEAEMYMQDARRWVSVECERETAASATGTTSDDEPPTPAEIYAAQRLVEQELCSAGCTAVDGTSMANGRGTTRTTQLQHSSSMAEAVRAHTSVSGPQAYGAHVNVQQALHQLSQRVATQVREANAILRPLRQEWEQVMSTAMLSPQDRHALHGFLRDDGQLKGSSSVGDNAEEDEGGGLAPPSVAAYVCERIAGQLQRARLACRFTKELRDREVLKMRRDLDEVEHDLQQFQSRERTLQDMYRHKRAQQL